MMMKNIYYFLWDQGVRLFQNCGHVSSWIFFHDRDHPISRRNVMYTCWERRSYYYSDSTTTGNRSRDVKVGYFEVHLYGIKSRSGPNVNLINQSVFSEIRVRTWIQVVLQIKKVIWLADLSDVVIRSLFF